MRRFPSNSRSRCSAGFRGRVVGACWLVAVAAGAQGPPATPYAWYRADTGVVTQTDGRLIRWESQTGGTTRQLDKSVQPPRQVASPLSTGGTAPVVSFSGQDLLWAGSGDWGELASDRMLAFHLRLKGGQDGFLFDGSTFRGKTRAQIRNGTWQVGVQADGASFDAADPPTTASTTNEWHTHLFGFEEVGGATEVTHWIDGLVSGVHTVAVDTSLAGLVLGANGSQGIRLHADVATVLVYDRFLPAGERDDLLAWIDQAWGGLTNMPFAVQEVEVTQDPRSVGRHGLYSLAAVTVTSLGNLPGERMTRLEARLLGDVAPEDISAIHLLASGADGAMDPVRHPILASGTVAADGSIVLEFDAPVVNPVETLHLAAALRGRPGEGQRLDVQVDQLHTDAGGGRILVPATPSPAGEISIATDTPYSVVLRRSGDDGSGNYRIPGLAVSRAGTVLAVFDIRYDGNEISSADLPANIDVGVMRSTDGGLTWSPMQVIMDYDASEPGSQGNGVGDPTILVDEQTGRIWVAALWSFGNNGFNGSGPGLDPVDTGQFVLCYSDDDGRTWTEPFSITPQVKDPAWRLAFQGPGKGITLRSGALVFPAQYRDAGGTTRSHFVYSTDGGQTWEGGPPAIASGSPTTTEAQIVELDDGKLLLSMRNHDGRKQRLWSLYTWNPEQETLGEGSWGTPWFSQTDPRVMGSLERYQSVLDGHPWSGLLFANPDDPNSRRYMTVRLSLDEGQTWPYSRRLTDRLAAYSCLTTLPDGDVALFYETGDLSSISEMVFTRFPLSWLTGTTDTDGDGVSDFQETVTGLDPADPADAGADDDADGVLNGQEVRAGTDPFDASSRLRLEGRVEDGSLRLEWNAVPRRVYSVEETDSFPGGTWTAVQQPASAFLRATSTHLRVERDLGPPQDPEGAGPMWFRLRMR